MYRKTVLLLVLLLYLLFTKKGPMNAHIKPANRILPYFGNSNLAADLLNEANNRVLTVAAYLQKIYRIGETDEETAQRGPIVDTQARRIAVAILRNYNYEDIYENDPNNAEKSTSFILNKKTMYVCLRDKNDPDKLVDLNVLVFVMLHELSHIGNYNGWAHGADFWGVFAFVLRAAIKCGAYEYRNYREKPQKYCGIMITYDPLSDKNLQKIEGEI